MRPIYIHEEIDVIGAHRADYMAHMTSGWDADARGERGMRCFGVWATVGSTGRWPTVVNMWELDGWEGLAANFAHELSHDSLQDPTLARWWSAAAELRSGGRDRILLPADYSPSIEALCAELPPAVCHLHQVVTLVHGRAGEYLSLLADEWLDTALAAGLGLTGAYRTAMVSDSEVIVVWSVPDWPRWAEVEQVLDRSSAVDRWRERTADLVLSDRRTLLCAAPLSPLRTGRQP